MLLKGEYMRQRGFEKISIEQWLKDLFELNDFWFNQKYIIDEDKVAILDQLKMPRRATRKSSGYDIFSPYDFRLHQNDTIKIPTGLKAYMLDNEELLIFPRSSVGFNYKIKIDNTIPKIDSDYYNCKKNEGHIWIKVTNTGDKVWEVKQGDAIMQGSFYNYLITDDDCPVNEERVGGIGSTNIN
jgi:dUTP pyrophosphatase